MKNESKRKYFLALSLAFGVAIFFGTVSCYGEDLLVSDPGLRAAIREELGLEGEEITPHDLLELRTLRASDVESLKGLGYAENLEELYLDNLDPFVDMEIIFGLDELTNLQITDSHLHKSDLSGVGALNRLEVLVLSHNSFHEFPALGGLEDLEELYFDFNRLESLEGIGLMKKLELVDLSRNKLTDISPLSKMSRLSFLDLSKNMIRDIEPLLAVEGLGEDDRLMLQYNVLDLSVDSPTLDVIRGLTSRGVEITFFPQCSRVQAPCFRDSS